MKKWKKSEVEKEEKEKIKTGGRKKEREKRKQKEIARGIKKTKENGVWMETEKVCQLREKEYKEIERKKKR